MPGIQIFTPPSSCFTSQYGFETRTDAAAGTVYVTASVGCPYIRYDVSVTLPQHSECCGPFSVNSGPIGLALGATSQVCPVGYGYLSVETYNGATTATCCPTVGGFTLDKYGIQACLITPPSISAVGTAYVTVTSTTAQSIVVAWNQAVINALGTTPDLDPATHTTGTQNGNPTPGPSLVLSPVSTTNTPYSTPTHAPVPTWTGTGSLIQGYCATPQYVLLDGPTVYWAPIIGCAGGKSDCCPYSVASTSYVADPQGYPVAVNPNQATLARCPDDYATVSGGCCPSGYQLWNAALGGQTPCYSSVSSYLVPPAIDIPNGPVTAAGISTTAGPTDNQKPTSAVVNIILAVQLTVQAPSPASTSSHGTGSRVSIGKGLAIVVGFLNFLF